MVKIGDLKKATGRMAFRSGMERFDLVTPLVQRGVPVKVPNVDEPVQR